MAKSVPGKWWPMSKFAKRAKLTFLVVLYVTISVATAFARDGAAGDSIAFGTGHALHVATFARERMSSCWILKHEVPLAVGHFDHFAISAGVNDAPGPCLEAIINHIDAGAYRQCRGRASHSDSLLRSGARSSASALLSGGCSGDPRDLEGKF